MVKPVAIGAEAELDGFIERRAGERKKANELEAMWAESTRRHNERRRREARAAWYAHEVRMQELHAALSEEHRAKAEALLEGPTGGGSLT